MTKLAVTTLIVCSSVVVIVAIGTHNFLQSLAPLSAYLFQIPIFEHQGTVIDVENYIP